MWAIERASPKKLEANPLPLLEISNEKESKNFPTIKSLCFPQKKNEKVEVVIFACDKIN